MLAFGSPPLSYQWRVNGTNLVNGVRLSGAITNLLAITNVQLSDAGAYTVVVTNVYGAVTSAPAVLTVLLPAPRIVVNDGSFGFLSGKFGFNVTGTADQVVVIEMSTNLSQTSWLALQTNTLGSGPLYFSDSQSATAGRRFYRVRVQ